MELAQSSRSSASVIVVYLHGVTYITGKELWFRVELHDDNIPPLNIEVYPVGLMYREDYGYSGSWEVIDDDIYWIGGFYQPEFQATRSLCEGLLKHDINNSDPSFWTVASPHTHMSIRRFSPFVAAVPTEHTQYLCVVSGAGYRSDSYDSNKWKQCGEIYDIKKESWHLIDADYNDISRYNTFNQIAQDVDKPNEIVFYSLRDGSMVVVDVANNSKGSILYPNEFDLWMRSLPPKGLIDERDVSMLKHVTNNVAAVLADGTFYWCTHVHLHLYGYDTKEQKWLRSPSLKNHFPQIVFDNKLPQYPILLGLGNGKFVLVLAVEEFVHSVMAIITIVKRVDNIGNSLNVSVDRIHHVYFGGEPGFMPKNGKAMLKNTGSGIMR